MDVLRSYKVSLLFNVVLFELIGYGTTGFFNPVEFLGSANLLIKIVLGFLALLMLGQIAVILILGRIREDAVCSDPECNKNIRSFVLVYKGALRCPRCGRWYHQACWQRYNKHSIRDAVRLGCTGCTGEIDLGRRRLFTEDDIFRDWR